jgi:hypothetical protein
VGGAGAGCSLARRNDLGLGLGLFETGEEAGVVPAHSARDQVAFAEALLDPPEPSERMKAADRRCLDQSR